MDWVAPGASEVYGILGIVRQRSRPTGIHGVTRVRKGGNDKSRCEIRGGRASDDGDRYCHHPKSSTGSRPETGRGIRTASASEQHQRAPLGKAKVGSGRESSRIRSISEPRQTTWSEPCPPFDPPAGTTLAEATRPRNRKARRTPPSFRPRPPLRIGRHLGTRKDSEFLRRRARQNPFRRSCARQVPRIRGTIRGASRPRWRTMPRRH